MQHTLAPPVSRAGRKSKNEDAVWTWSLNESSDTSFSILAVADGMGGHDHGEKASQIAIQALKDAVEEWEDLGPGKEDLRSECQQLFERIDKALRMYVRKSTEATDIGTTFVLAIVDDRKINIAHIGDSRAYWVSEDHKVEQLTEDHSAAAEAVREGRMTEEEAAQSPYRHALIRSLDGSGESDPDFITRRIQKPGFLCLCSDGLSGPVTRNDFAQVLLRDVPLEQATQSLADLAYAKDSKDNISLVVLKCGKIQQKSAPVGASSPGSSREEGDDQSSLLRWMFQNVPLSKEEQTTRSATALLGLLSLLLVVLTGLYLYVNSSFFSGASNQSVPTAATGGSAIDTNTNATPPQESPSDALGLESIRSSHTRSGIERDSGDNNISSVSGMRGSRSGEATDEGPIGIESDSFISENVESKSKNGIRRNKEIKRECKTVFATSEKKDRLKKYKRDLEEKLEVNIKPFYKKNGVVFKLVSSKINTGSIKKGEVIGKRMLLEEGIYELVKSNIDINNKKQMPYKHCFIR